MTRSNPSLYSQPTPEKIPTGRTKEELLAWLRERRPDSKKMFSNNLREIEGLAQDAESDSSITRGIDYADMMRAYSKLLKCHLKSGEIYSVANVAFSLGIVVCELVSDAQYAKKIDDNWRRERNLIKSKMPDRETIIRAIKENATYKQAAEQLRTSPKQLRRWRARLDHL